VREHGLPDPLVNTRVQDIEVDFLWPDSKLIVEVDGPGHQRPRTQREDAARDERLAAAGYRVKRVT
jgi:very-short-patch-repair endonuclease